MKGPTLCVTMGLVQMVLELWWLLTLGGRNTYEMRPSSSDFEAKKCQEFKVLKIRLFLEALFDFNSAMCHGVSMLYYLATSLVDLWFGELEEDREVLLFVLAFTGP